MAGAVTANSASYNDLGGKRVFRPRVLIHGKPGQGLTTYLGMAQLLYGGVNIFITFFFFAAPAVLHHMEKLPCHRLDISTLYSNAARSPEEALCQVSESVINSINYLLFCIVNIDKYFLSCR